MKTTTISERVAGLTKAWKDDEDVMAILNTDLRSIGNYVNAVYAMEYQLPIIRMRYEGEDVRDRIMKLDTNRRSAHERAIMGIKRLNRFSRMAGLPKFYSGDEEDRYEIADFCGQVVTELFGGRTDVGNIDIWKEVG